jgi:hypothetical protein
MYTFRVILAPKFGVVGGILNTEVRAGSVDDARRIAQAQFPNHTIMTVQKVS